VGGPRPVARELADLGNVFKARLGISHVALLKWLRTYEFPPSLADS
jgi:hypothetical protein